MFRRRWWFYRRFQYVRPADAAADNTIIADGDAAGNAGFGGDNSVPNRFCSCGRFGLVIDFGAVADGGVAHRAAVDVGVRADFYVVAQRYRAGLRDFKP